MGLPQKFCGALVGLECACLRNGVEGPAGKRKGRLLDEPLRRRRRWGSGGRRESGGQEGRG